ncbi:hypothetical protein AVEN_15522-1 [Araneus ventricosus]|uniref:Uncharacterized protein n=1 Tax=Araneus ventricosus TaxID=182803 RepID=A0A4Y2NJU4_ARAVE|nr:hypothetical protein AVEN_15522-1 [Araneus ventricosus]
MRRSSVLQGVRQDLLPEMGPKNHTPIAVPTREARTRLLIQRLIIREQAVPSGGTDRGEMGANLTERMPDLKSTPRIHSKFIGISLLKYHGLIHHPWLNPDQRLKRNVHEHANADRNDRLDVSPNWRVGEKLVWLEG